MSTDLIGLCFIEVRNVEDRYRLHNLKISEYWRYGQQSSRLDRDTVSYFKSMSDDTGIPYQSLIHLYLRDCVSNERKL